MVALRTAKTRKNKPKLAPGRTWSRRTPAGGAAQKVRWHSAQLAKHAIVTRVVPSLTKRDLFLYETLPHASRHHD